MRALLSILAVLLFLAPIDAQEQVIKELDSYIEKARKDWGIPGVAIAVVKDGKTVLSKGYGLKDNTDPKSKVDEHTIFAIASNTKAFISASIATLVEDGKLNWDDKVVDYLPYFELYDPYVTAECTVSDLLCHRVGFDTFSGDLLWYGTTLSREEVIKSASQLEPVNGFRSGYGYQNIMFMAAGEVIEEVTGMAWDDYVKREFLEPLAMESTISSTYQLAKRPNHAEPHNEVDGKNIPIDWVNWDNMGPAGSLISSVDDMSRWISLQLGDGSIDGQEYWTQDHTNLMRTPHTPKQLSNWHRSNFPSKHFSAYGLGWDLYDYHGRLVVNHGGGYDGFISQTILVPEEDLGFIILTNSNSYFPYAMMYHILDMYLAPEEAKDWGAYMLELKQQGDERKLQAEEELIASRHKDTKPSLELEAYAGRYTDPKYGSVVISYENEELKFQFEPTPLYHGTISHWHHDTFRLSWGEQHFLPKGFMNFILDFEGNVEELRVRCPNPDLYFYELELIKEKSE